MTRKQDHEPAEHAVILVAHFLAWIEEQRSFKLVQMFAESHLVFRLQVLQDALLNVLIVRRFNLQRIKNISLQKEFRKCPNSSVIIKVTILVS